MKQSGFTLLELLIAMALFSLLGIAGYQLLDRTLGLERHISQHDLQLRQLQRALNLFERDVVQATPYPLMDDPSGRQALIGQPASLRLTRGGWSNPLELPRGDTLQVQHRWANGRWERSYNGANPADEPVQVQTLLEGLSLKTLNYVDHQGQRHGTWPVGPSPLTLPSAIELELDAPGFASIRRVILLPGNVDRQGVGDE